MLKIKNMQYKIKYCTVLGDSILAIPECTHSEIVEVATYKDLKKYIESKTDDYGNKFKEKNSFGFQFISNRGGVKISEYLPPKVKKI